MPKSKRARLPTSTTASSPSKPKATASDFLRPLFSATASHVDFKKYYSKLPILSNEDTDAATTTSRKILGLDCEMIMTTTSDSNDDAKHELAKVSLLQYEPSSKTFTTLLNTIVKPTGKITDLLSHVSGIQQSDLESAVFTQPQVREMISRHIDKQDVLIGHSLWSDLTSLDFWDVTHVIDTSFLVAVKGADRLTLGLDDLSQVLLGESFRQELEAHNPLVDAEYAVRVAMKLLSDQSELPLMLEETPPRYHRRLTLHGFDASFDLDDFIPLISHGSSNTTIRKPIKFTKKEGQIVGSISLEFKDKSQAKEAFLSLNQPQNHHPHGWPDHQGFMRKILALNGNIVGEAVSYGERPILSCHFDLLVSNSQKIGMVMGKRGCNIIAIQRMSGTRIANERLKQDTKLTIHGDEQGKVEQAVSLITRAIAGEKFAE